MGQKGTSEIDWPEEVRLESLQESIGAIREQLLVRLGIRRLLRMKWSYTRALPRGRLRYILHC